MKIWKRIVMVLCLAAFLGTTASAQCSICTKTAQQLGERPAKSLNAGILYLAATPLLVVGVIAYRWWKANGSSN